MPFSMDIGDLKICGEPQPKLLKAAAVIGGYLHLTFSREPWISHPDKSKDSCILSSLTVRDFLQKVGFAAEVRTTAFYIDAYQGSEQVHSLGIGIPGQSAEGSGWDGHLAVVVDGWLIDTTLYQVHRDAWDGLPGMLMIPMAPVGHMFRDLPVLASVSYVDQEKDNYECNVFWLDRSEDRSWKSAPDSHRNRRHDVVKALYHEFGPWRDK